MTEQNTFKSRPSRGQGRYRYRGAKAATGGKRERTETTQRSTPSMASGATPKGTLRVIPIGGLEEIGRNCTIFEYGEDIIVVDMGIQFPEEDMPGIDFIIPNLAYLKGKEKRIRGVFITHGHMDHLGAIPYLMQQIGNPPIYAAPLTLGIIQRRQEEFPRAPKLHLIKIDSTKRVPVGKHFVIEPFHVNHNITDAFGLLIHTPVGTIATTGDFKFDYTPVDEKPAEIARLAEVGSKGILALMADSTNANSPGHQISEKDVGENLEQLIRKADGRIIIGAFASLLTRHQQVIDIAEKVERKVLLLGRSIHNYVEIAQRLKYFKVPKGILIEEADFNKLPDNKVLVICTGAMGQKNSALMRIASNEHRLITLKKGDTILFSSSVIPGNERTVERLQDSLVRKGATVYNNAMMDIHTGGHAKQEDLKLLHRLIRPKYFIPIHGNHFRLKVHGNLAIETGVDPKNVFIADNGQIIEFTKTGGTLTKKHVPADHVFVDGLGVGDVSNVVLRERQAMAEEGMFVIIVTIDGKTGRAIGEPDIISRGFIYMKENARLIGKVHDKVKKILDEPKKDTPAFDAFIREKIRNEIGQLLYANTRRRPMVLPVVNEV
ncbi:ribonuclease J [Candidatus Uhrbacteria bacterium CG10_big_fil_rev_8_21_14_0_10_48_11]|uniref:Ribonuclease J n=1 Tax=Candidatus Uhrbacteria bacterium CG10_big_fil_rev_8_21_14_0_10_48_11 TaxID=1975037 RepID=A0A2M8LFT9_9BACT|nr:MAG: ribonuclease J [Candidatus Uhrbacteria bacterium CG10_big_fil_rev_8_21_14_0_10_48_11]